MVEKTIVYAFKIIAVMIISLLMWNVFIGAPSSNAQADTDTTTMASYFNKGSVFEQLAFGGATGGFKAELGETWLQMTGFNGLQTELRSLDEWNACAHATGNNTGTHPHSWVQSQNKTYTPPSLP